REEPANKVFYCFFQHGRILGLCVLHVLENVQHQPAACQRHLPQSWAGIGGDGVGDGFEQGQVVGRVAVEIRALETVQAQPPGSQPVVDARDLALFEAGHALYGARVAPRAHLGNRGDEVGNVEGPGNGGGDELVGGRDDGAKVALPQVPVDELARHRQYVGLYDLAHEYFVPLVQVGRGGGGQQAQHEFGGFLSGEVAGVVAFHQLVVQALGLDGVAGAAGAGQKIG